MLILLCAILCGSLFCGLVSLRSLRGYLAATAVIAVVLSVAVSNWPLHAAYRLSRPSFEQVAAEVRQGKGFDEPRQVGLFRVARAELNHRGVVCLWTDLEPSGYTGFVQCGPEKPPFNIWSHQALDATWQFISED